MSPKLKQNGGEMKIGNCDLCRRKGFGVGSNVKIHETEFLNEWSENYAPIVRQLLWYKDGKDGKPPPGYQQATLHQCFAQGFAAASMKRAKKLRKHSAVQSRRVKTQPPKSNTANQQSPKQPLSAKATLPLKTR